MRELRYLYRMARAEAVQLNIRSRFAKERAALLAREMGMTTTQVIEEALRAYLPADDGPSRVGLVRKGAVLVKRGDGKRVTLAEANAALDQVRCDDR